jgi:hypothetical protein
MSEQDQQAATQQLPPNDADATSGSARRAHGTPSFPTLQEADVAVSTLPHNATYSAVPGRSKPSLSSRLSLMGKSNTSINSSTRMGLHDKLRAYESQRRLAYAAKFESSSLYWKSFRDLLAASIHETGRAQRLVLGTSRAHKLYSDALQAMYEDVFLDDKGNVLLKANQQKKLSQVRKKPEATKTDGSGGSVLTTVRQAQHVMAERFGENANNMDVEIAQEIGHLLDDLKEKFTTMEKLGDAILGELERTDQEVSDAWGK